jgi:hypothetical protein
MVCNAGTGGRRKSLKSNGIYGMLSIKLLIV